MRSQAELAPYEAVLGYTLPPPPPRFRDFGEFGGYLATNLFPAIRTLAGVRALLRGGLGPVGSETGAVVYRTPLGCGAGFSRLPIGPQ